MSAETTVQQVGFYAQVSLPRRLANATRRFIRQQPIGAVALAIIIVLVLGAVFADYLRTSDPKDFGDDILAKPGWTHWFGTNRQGNDLWSRVVYGARPSLIIGLFTVVFGMAGGVMLGLLAGYFGGWVDMLISRVTEFLISFPPIITVMVVVVALANHPLGPIGFNHPERRLIAAITIVVIPLTTRIVRGGVIQERNRPYVESAQVLGASGLRIVFRHILPNIVPLALVLASSLLPSAILFESVATFLGVGLAPGDPSWGNDLGGNTRILFTTAPWLAIFPGLALSITVFAFNLLGDSLRDILDPRLRSTGV